MECYEYHCGMRQADHQIGIEGCYWWNTCDAEVPVDDEWVRCGAPAEAEIMPNGMPSQKLCRDHHLKVSWQLVKNGLAFTAVKLDSSD